MKDASVEGKEKEFVSNVNFDEYANTYRQALRASFRGFGKNDALFDILKIYSVKKWVIDEDKTSQILDFGCGIGKLTGFLAKAFPHSSIYGYDISKECICVARKENSKVKNIFFIDDFPSGPRYDFIIVANIFHHIAPTERINTLREIKNILKPQGKIAFFEHNPFNPFTRYIVKRCLFDAGVNLIRRNEFIRMIERCGLEIEIKHYILFFPWLSGVFRRMEYFLRNVPAGAQYFLVAGNKK